METHLVCLRLWHVRSVYLPADASSLAQLSPGRHKPCGTLLKSAAFESVRHTPAHKAIFPLSHKPLSAAIKPGRQM